MTLGALGSLCAALVRALMAWPHQVMAPKLNGLVDQLAAVVPPPHV